MATFCDGIVQEIERTECIGNSLVKINSNFSGLESAGCDLENELQSEIARLSTLINTLSTSFTTLSTNMQNIGTKPTAQIFGSGGAHSLGSTYDPVGAGWISITSGQIVLRDPGIYHFEIFYGGNYTGGCYNYHSSMQPVLRRISDSAVMLGGPVLGSRDSNYSGDGGSFSGIINSASSNLQYGIYINLGGACSGYLGGTSALITKIS